MSVLSSQRYHRVLARYGHDVTITEQPPILSDKPWQRAPAPVEAKTHHGRAIIGEAKSVSRTQTGSTKSMYQQRDSLIHISNFTEEQLLACYLKYGDAHFHILRVSKIEDTGPKQIYRALLVSHKGAL